MPKIAYKEKNFTVSSLNTINQANDIIAVYQGQGYDLTLRQLYYQFVSRGLIYNTMREYKRLGSIINDARLAGLIDWSAIEDRTRQLSSMSHWTSPADIVESAAESYRIDMWKNQKFRPEVWIEKEALAGVISKICQELDVPYLSCRGYTSQSEMWSSAMRLKRIKDNGKTPVIYHFGDHDPSGIDMTRDISKRMQMFIGGITLVRVALNMEQVEEFRPPPNPAKTTDSRFESYVNRYGNESWELDALEPSFLVKLVRDNVLSLRDPDSYELRKGKETRERKQLRYLSDNWSDLEDQLTD